MGWAVSEKLAAGCSTILLYVLADHKPVQLRVLLGCVMVERTVTCHTLQDAIVVWLTVCRLGEFFWPWSTCICKFKIISFRNVAVYIFVTKIQNWMTVADCGKLKFVYLKSLKYQEKTDGCCWSDGRQCSYSTYRPNTGTHDTLTQCHAVLYSARDMPDAFF